MAKEAEPKDEEIVEAPAEAPKEEAPAEEEKFAKSGKKSKKHIEEVKAEEERQARKEERAKEEAEAEKKPKGAKPITRPLIERRGKNYRKVSEKIEKGKIYTLADAMKLLRPMSVWVSILARPTRTSVPLSFYQTATAKPSA